ncbi:MAG: hypothetical protein LH702_31215, partial [Phormidesmis sp. CAN_BIN44]|nr:hypothetical protein [Phormidesmis sp. CAN_BIN44]
WSVLYLIALSYLVEDRKQQLEEKNRRKQTQEGISTPLGEDFKYTEDGNAQVMSGSVEVTILPDQVSDELSDKKAGAETKFNLEGGGAPSFEFVNRKVTNVNSVPPIKITIQTTYRSGVSSASDSAYGRGTTDKDRADRNTSLRFHEGSHGSDYINYLKMHPIPSFQGREGMTVERFKQSQQEYIAAINKYKKAMSDYSKANTDNVGKKK